MAKVKPKPKPTGPEAAYSASFRPLLGQNCYDDRMLIERAAASRKVGLVRLDQDLGCSSPLVQMEITPSILAALKKRKFGVAGSVHTGLAIVDPRELNARWATERGCDKLEIYLELNTKWDWRGVNFIPRVGGFYIAPVGLLTDRRFCEVLLLASGVTPPPLLEEALKDTRGLHVSHEEMGLPPLKKISDMFSEEFEGKRSERGRFRRATIFRMANVADPYINIFSPPCREGGGGDYNKFFYTAEAETEIRAGWRAQLAALVDLLGS